MDELDSLSVEAVRRGLPIASALFPLALMVAVVVLVVRSAPVPETRPAPPFDLGACSWRTPSEACLREGPEELRGLPHPDNLGHAIEDRLYQALRSGEVAYIGWKAHRPLAFDADAIPKHVWRVPNPESGRFVQDDGDWYALQRSILGGGGRLTGERRASLGGWDPLASNVRVVRIPPTSAAYGTPQVEGRWELRQWAHAFAKAETRRRAATADRLYTQHRADWQEQVAAWKQREHERAQSYATRQMFAAGFVFLFPLLAAFAYHLRRQKLQLRLTRTHLFIDGDPVLLTELPDDAERLPTVIAGLLPTGFRLRADEDGFLQAVIRAVQVQHQAEERLEDRARLASLEANRT